MTTQARLPNLGEHIYGEMASIRLDRMLREMELLLDEVSTGPWKADIIENLGNNWHLAGFGESHNGGNWILTTDHVRCSEYNGDAEADAKFCALARNLMPQLIEELKRLQAVTR